MAPDPAATMARRPPPDPPGPPAAPVTKADWLAGDPDDPFAPAAVPGVARIVAEAVPAAAAACREAMAAWPQEPRFPFLLARVLEAELVPLPWFEGARAEVLALIDQAHRLAGPGGYPAAHHLAARMLLHDLEADPAAAFDAFLTAAEAGVEPAMAQVALMADQGMGVAEDPALAWRWRERLARSGRPADVLELAQHWRHGRGTARDPARALSLYRQLAEDHLYGPAMVEIADMAAMGDVPSLRLGDARGWAVRALQTPAGRGDAAELLAQMFLSGHGVARSLATAASLMMVAAQAGLGTAMLGCAGLMTLGLGTPRDPQAARRWLGRAAAAFEPQALFADGVLEWLAAAAEAAAPAAERRAQALERWHWAARQAHPGAQVMLAFAYAQGLGVGLDLAEAERLLAAAVTETEDPVASIALSLLAMPGSVDLAVALEPLRVQFLEATRDAMTRLDFYVTIPWVEDGAVLEWP